MTIVLIVDDFAFMRNHLKTVLLNNNLVTKIIECKNGLDAVRSYMKYKPSIVTMDFDMPEFNGMKTSKEIHNYDKNAKIIMISAKNQDALTSNPTKNGISAFIQKPFQPFEIKEAFEFVLA